MVNQYINNIAKYFQIKKKWNKIKSQIVYALAPAVEQKLIKIVIAKRKIIRLFALTNVA